MRQVTRDHFYSIMGPLDVHPHIVGEWDREWGYVQIWKLRNGSTVGKSDGGTYLQDSRYFLPDLIAQRVSCL